MFVCFYIFENKCLTFVLFEPLATIYIRLSSTFCAPISPPEWTKAIALSLIFSSLAVLLGHIYEFILFYRVTKAFQLNKLLDYFNEVIKCIAPATMICFVFSTATIFVVDIETEIILAYIPTLLDAILVYEASVLRASGEASSSISQHASHISSSHHHNPESVISKEARSQIKNISMSVPYSPPTNDLEA